MDFKVNETLFAQGHGFVTLSKETFSDDYNSLKTTPPDYIYVTDINSLVERINTLKENVEKLDIRVNDAKNNIITNIPGSKENFDKAYDSVYSQFQLLSAATILGNVNSDSENIISFYEEAYEYLKDSCNGDFSKLPEELQETYKELEKISQHNDDLDELKKLEENPVILEWTGSGNRRIPTNSVEYQEYCKKVNDLKEKIKTYNESINPPEPKWYEDIWASVKQTGAEWKEGFVSLKNGEGFGEMWDATKKTGATAYVVKRSVESGIQKLGEQIVVDSLSFLGGSIAAGATWLFHDIWSENDKAGNVMDATLDFVRRDLVGEKNQYFYENTAIGEWINENSTLKYDSAGTKAIQTGTEFVGKAIIATAATIVTGGAAAPIAIGALYGIGSASERYAQSVGRENGESYNYLEAFGRAAAGGVVGAAEFYGYGQMGAGVLGVNISPQASTSFVKNFLVKDTILDSAAVVTDHVVNVAFGDESWQKALMYGGVEFALALGLNAFGARQATNHANNIVNNFTYTLEQNDITKSLLHLKKLNINDYDILIKNVENIKIDNETSNFIKKMFHIYGDGSYAAKTKYNNFFKNFREHGIKHSTEVASYAEKIAKNIDGVNLDEVIYASFIHDFGMRGGYMYVDEEIAKKIINAGGMENLAGKYIEIDSLSNLNFSKKDFLDLRARANHPLNSALSVLIDDVLPPNVDKDVIALLAMTHSKSTSGIKHFSSEKEWLEAVDKLDQALKQYNIDNNNFFTFDSKRIKEMISNPKEFTRLQDEALAIRDADAMSSITKVKKGTLMQDGTISRVKTVEKRIDYNTPVVSAEEEYSKIIDKIYKVDDKRPYSLDGFSKRKLTDEEYFSKKIHIGEDNVSFDSDYVNGEYKVRVNIVEPNKAPNSTFDAIEERIGEVNTYTNCDSRSFEIVLPKEAEGTALGKWYEQTLDDLKNLPKKKKLVFTSDYELFEGIINQTEWYKQQQFFDNLKIIYE